MVETGDFVMRSRWHLVVLLIIRAAFGQQSGEFSCLDPKLPPDRRAAELVARMTLEEKVLQMQSAAPSIPRLGVPSYNWWNEALHGVAQGRATVFPQAIGIAATWDTDLMYRVADIISTEARAKYHDVPFVAETPLPGEMEKIIFLSIGSAITVR